MKKSRIIALFLIMVLLLLLFTGCAKTPDRAEESEPVEGPGLDDLVETDSLVIYIMKGNETLEQRRINQFTVLYDVDVEVVRVAADEYQERVMNDLAGGSGPDILFLNDLYSLDFTKAALNGNFLDLTDILAEDPEFSKDDYLDGVFEACQVNGRQYIVPFSCMMPLEISSEESLQKLSFDWSEIETTSDYINALARMTPVATKDLGFSSMLFSKNNFYALFSSSGIQLLDYKNGDVLPDEEGLREFMEAYKAFFPYDYDEADGSSFANYDSYMLSSGTIAFFEPISIEGITSTINCMKLDSCDYVLQACPGQSGEVIKSIFGQIAINANSKNTLNAYKFVKYMLSKEAQSDPYMIYYMPISKDAIHNSIHGANALYEANGYYFNDYDNLAFSEEEANMIEAEITKGDQFVRMMPLNVFNMVQESMLPFFQDEASYEDCLADLKNKLTLYLSE